MAKGRALLVGIPAGVLIACLMGAYATRGALGNLQYVNIPGAGRVGTGSGLVDQRPFLTAQSLAGQAISSEEQELAREAERLADHAVDQAFAMALRQAELQTRRLTGAALELLEKVNRLAALVKEDQARVTALKGKVVANGPETPEADDLEIAQAQLQLDTDELNDAQEDLARESGDRR